MHYPSLNQSFSEQVHMKSNQHSNVGINTMFQQHRYCSKLKTIYGKYITISKTLTTFYDAVWMSVYKLSFDRLHALFTKLDTVIHIISKLGLKFKMFHKGHHTCLNTGRGANYFFAFTYGAYSRAALTQGRYSLEGGAYLRDRTF